MMNKKVRKRPLQQRGLDDITKLFVGEKYEQIKKQKFNFCAAFFGVFYLFYRKMYLYATLYLLISSITKIISWNLMFFVINTTQVEYPLSIIIGIFIVILLLVGVSNILFIIPLGLFTNKIYLKFADKKVKDIIKCYGEEEARKVAVIRGGTNIILGLSLVPAMVSLVITIITLSAFFSPFINRDFTALEKSQNIQRSINEFADKNPSHIPQALEDYTCTKNVYNNVWTHTKGKIKPFLDDCNSYLKSVENKYSFSSWEEIEEATIVLGIDGHMKNGSTIKFNDGVECSLNEKFTCKK